MLISHFGNYFKILKLKLPYHNFTFITNLSTTTYNVEEIDYFGKKSRNLKLKLRNLRLIFRYEKNRNSRLKFRFKFETVFESLEISFRFDRRQLFSSHSVVEIFITILKRN